MEPNIPNFNTLSILIDRLIVENVQLAYFENAVEHDLLSDHQIAEFQTKMALKHELIDTLKKELRSFMEEVFLSEKYDSTRQQRSVRLRIPNLDTLSTLIDRLSIENVKLDHFKNAVESETLPDDMMLQFQKKIMTQQEIITALKKDLARCVEDIFLAGKYEYITEERTFV